MGEKGSKSIRPQGQGRGEGSSFTGGQRATVSFWKHRIERSVFSGSRSGKRTDASGLSKPSGDEPRTAEAPKSEENPSEQERFQPKLTITAPENVGGLLGSQPMFPTRWILKHAKIHDRKGCAQATSDQLVKVCTFTTVYNCAERQQFTLKGKKRDSATKIKTGW